MNAKARLLKLENVSGTNAAGKDYNFKVGHFLDLGNYDKIRLMLPDDSVTVLANSVGKDGLLEVGVNPKSDKLTFGSFRVAA